ncbi:hypothetical protein SDC9_76159 [bioreactor metagenome]|uniref:Sporulation protein YqfD n=1 Tax=bioreactor metagenome TaxID=1076179 RepID=A0A644YMT3_9ZZZZ
MKKIINFFRGSVTVTITGAFPERFLNLCAQRGVPFWSLAWLDPYTLRLRVLRRDSRKLDAIGERTLCTISLTERKGLPFFLHRFRERYALLAGLALSIAAVCLLSQFIMVIDVTGNENISTAAILTELDRQGVRPGVYGPSLNLRETSHEVLLCLPKLSFMAINLHGIRAEVIVREANLPPDIVDEKTPADIVSTATGIITRMEVLSGEPLVKEGSTVLAGEVLISGVMDIKEPAYSTVDMGVRLVHAQGRIYARTWHTLRAVIPLEAGVKLYSGEETARYSLTFFGKRFNFYSKDFISSNNYDKISKTKALTLPGGFTLPISFRKEIYRSYELLPCPTDEAEAKALLENSLGKALRATVGEGEILRTDITSEAANGLLTVTLLAECSEQIGREVPIP